MSRGVKCGSRLRRSDDPSRIESRTGLLTLRPRITPGVPLRAARHSSDYWCAGQLGKTLVHDFLVTKSLTVAKNWGLEVRIAGVVGVRACYDGCFEAIPPLGVAAEPARISGLTSAINSIELPVAYGAMAANEGRP